jgi:hypothetical protein
MLLTSQTAVVVTGTTRLTPVQVTPDVEWAEFLLNVTAAATAAGDTLDVYVQASSDGGTTWDDLLHFTSVLGNGGAKKYLVRWQGMIAPTTAQAAPQDAALSAGVAQGPHGNLWSVKWVIVSASSPSFSFTVSASGHVKRLP